MREAYDRLAYRVLPSQDFQVNNRWQVLLTARVARPIERGYRKIGSRPVTEVSLSASRTRLSALSLYSSRTPSGSRGENYNFSNKV
jgi:hypothetical protein